MAVEATEKKAEAGPARKSAGRRRTPDKTAADRFTNEEPETIVGYYRQMVLVRRFEERCAEMYQRAKIGGYCHLNLGEEATVVGLMAGLEPRDYLFTNYREHGYALARGIEPGRVMAELFGRQTGVSGGWGGSMHLFDLKARLLGGYAIVGGQIPLATGAALAVSYRGGDEVVMCQMGDGTTNIGAFHECLNLAGVWNLPIVFVVVNNLLGMGTRVEASSAEPELWRRGCAYRIPGLRVDGNDPLAVREATRDAVEHTRSGQRPFLLETMSFRMRGHSVVDPARYRSKEDTDRALEADPVLSFRAKLVAASVLDDAAVVQLEAEVDQEVDAAVAFADESPDPPRSELFAKVYATVVANAPHLFPGDPVVSG
jgi:pyruvate dehydrogenase E1 component alpha subunit